MMPLRYSPEQGLPVASNSGRDVRHTTQRSFVSFQRWPPVRRLARSVVITKPPFLDDRMWALDRVGRVSDTGLGSTRRRLLDTGSTRLRAARVSVPVTSGNGEKKPAKRGQSPNERDQPIPPRQPRNAARLRSLASVEQQARFSSAAG